MSDVKHDFYIDRKAGDGIPSGSLSTLRGRGPRRGNLEDLLDYWRKIMKKPGGFRRCIVILADHPELYPLEPLCAWLHHETTGKWPGEGRGRSGGGKKKPGKRRRRRKGIGQTHILVKPSIEGRVSGTRLPIDVKTGLIRSNSRVGRAVQGAGSVILPGDLSDFRSPVRSAIFEALTPGPPGGGRNNRGGLVRGGRRARNQFRCPPGFEKGGTFTNSGFSTCGLQVLSIPSSGPGALSPNASQAVRTLAEDASLVRKIGDLHKNSNSSGIVRASQIPPSPKEVAIQARQRSVDLIIEEIDTSDETFGGRFVRRDGIILEPVQSLPTISSLGEFDDMNDGVLVYNEALRTTSQIGQDEVPTLATGLRALVFHIPGVGSLSLRRDGGDLDEAERIGIRRKWSSALQVASSQVVDPSAALRRFAESSEGRFVIDENITENNDKDFDRELVVVESGNRKLTVPRWVFSTYLSRVAPRRNKEEPAFTLVEEVGKKTVQRYAFERKSRVVPDAAAYDNPDHYDWIRGSVGHFHNWTGHEEKLHGRRHGGNNRGIRRPGRRGRGAGAIFDPGTNQFRCPVGTANGGQFSDRTARNCGARLDPSLIDALYTIGGFLDIPEAQVGKGNDRDAGDWAEAVKLVFDKDAALATDNRIMGDPEILKRVLGTQISEIRSAAAEVRESRGPGGGALGRTIGQDASDGGAVQRVEAPNFDGFEKSVDELDGVLSSDAVQKVDDQQVALALFGQIEEVVNVEAVRRDAFPDRTPENQKQTGRINQSISSAVEGMRSWAERLTNSIDVTPEDRVAIDERAAARQTERAARREARQAGRETRRANRAAGRANLFSRFTSSVDDPLRPENRRDKADTPELDNLTDVQKQRLEQSMLRHWEELDQMWADKLGNDEPDYERIADWVRENDDPTGIWDARRNDWLELYSAVSEDREDDREFDDFVGRLSPSAREDVTRNARLGQEQEREEARQRRLEERRVTREAAERERREREARDNERREREAEVERRREEERSRATEEREREERRRNEEQSRRDDQEAEERRQREQRDLIEEIIDRVEDDEEAGLDEKTEDIEASAYNLHAAREEAGRNRFKKLVNRLTERYSGKDKPWKKYRGKSMSNVFDEGPDAVEKLVKEMFSIDHEFDQGTVMIGGKEYRYTTIPRASIEANSRGSREVTMRGKFERRIYDGDKLVGTQNTGTFTRQIRKDGSVYHAMFFNDSPLSFTPVDAQGNPVPFGGGGPDLVPEERSAKGRGLAGAINSNATAFYSVFGTNPAVSTASDGPYVWAKQGFRQSGFSSRQVSESTSGLIRAFDKNTTELSEGDSLDVRADDHRSPGELMASLWGTFLTGGDRKRRDRLDAISNSDEASTQDVILAIESDTGHPADGKLALPLFSALAFGRSEERWPNRESDIQGIMDAAGVTIDGVPFSDWHEGLSSTERKDSVNALIGKASGQFRNASLNAGEQVTSDIIPDQGTFDAALDEAERVSVPSVSVPSPNPFADRLLEAPTKAQALFDEHGNASTPGTISRLITKGAGERPGEAVNRRFNAEERKIIERKIANFSRLAESRSGPNGVYYAGMRDKVIQELAAHDAGDGHKPIKVETLNGLIESLRRNDPDSAFATQLENAEERILETINKLSPEFRPRHIRVSAEDTSLGGGLYNPRTGTVEIHPTMLLDDSEMSLAERVTAWRALGEAHGLSGTEAAKWAKSSAEAQTITSGGMTLEYVLVHEAAHGFHHEMGSLDGVSGYHDRAWQLTASEWLSANKPWLAKFHEGWSGPTAPGDGRGLGGGARNPYFYTAIHFEGAVDPRVHQWMSNRTGEDRNQLEARGFMEVFAEAVAADVAGVPYPGGDKIAEFIEQEIKQQSKEAADAFGRSRGPSAEPNLENSLRSLRSEPGDLAMKADGIDRVSGLDDGFREAMQSRMTSLGITRDGMRERSREMLGAATPAMIESARDWYPEVNKRSTQMVADINEQHGSSYSKEQMFAVIAGLSPAREFGKNIGDARIAVTALAADEPFRLTKSYTKDGERRTLNKANLALHAALVERVGADNLKTIKPSDFLPEERALLVASHPQLRNLGNTTGLVNVVRSVSVLQGDDIEDAMSGPKMRSFYSNILDPEGDRVTIDTWMYRGMIDPDLKINTSAGWMTVGEYEKSSKTRKVQDLFQGSPSRAASSVPSNVGLYPEFAEIVREVAEENNLTPAALQAIMWEVARTRAGYKQTNFEDIAGRFES